MGVVEAEEKTSSSFEYPTGRIGIALNALALQYTIVSSPIISTPHRGGGTGISKSAPLSRLF